jgi:hypothetical protein
LAALVSSASLIAEPLDRQDVPSPVFASAFSPFCASMALRLRARHGGVKVIPLVPRGPMVIVVLLVALFCLFFGLSELYEASGPATGASLWREQALALALLAFGLHLLWLIFRTARQEVRIGPSTLSVWLRGRHFEAAWTEIADITDHDVPYWQRNEGNQPHITIRLHARLRRAARLAHHPGRL